MGTDRRRRRRLAALAGPVLATQLACVDLGAGRCGAYTETPGTARITAVEAAPADQYNCKNDPVRVLFDFTPADARLASLAAMGVRFTIAGGANPPRAWVTASGLNTGSDHPAVRSDQPHGPCPPVHWKLSDVDEMAGLSACF